MTMVSGFLLFACNGANYFELQVLESSNLVEVSIKQGNKAMEAEADGKYNIEKGSNLKVEISAKEYGVDMSALSVKMEGVEKKLILNEDYNTTSDKGVLNYGYFLISNTNSNLQIIISGAKRVKSTFTFEISQQQLENENIVEKLKMTYIDLTIKQEVEDTVEQDPENTETPDTTEPYKNLYEFLTGDQSKSFEREFDSVEGIENKYKTFKVKFDGINPFNLADGFPFKVVGKDNVKQTISDMILVDDKYFVVDLGNIGKFDEYKIVVDFSEIGFNQYNISLPTDNLTYTVRVDGEVVDFSQEKILTLKKLLSVDKADYSNVKMFANSYQLSKIEGSETEKEVKFLIPKGITPFTTGGFNVYRVSVLDIDYVVPAYSLSASSNEGSLSNGTFIKPGIFAVDEEGYVLGITGIGPNGEKLGLEGEKCALLWNYEYDYATRSYHSMFDLYDYNIYANDKQIMNVKEILADETADVVLDLADGLKFKATYNSSSETFDRFQIEFVCNSDMDFKFDDFVVFEKNINVGFDFDDERIDTVEYAITSYNTTNLDWQELSRAESVMVSVTGKQLVVFRLGSTKNTIGTHEFTIVNKNISNSWLEGEVQIENGINYTILKFVVSDIQYSGSMDFKLTPSASVP